jgi:general secretion pathway protein G
MQNSKCRKTRDAFTLMEVLLVLVILVILGAVAVGVYSNIQASSYKKVAQIQVDLISDKCELYRIAMGNFPSDLQDLFVRPSVANADNWEGPYFEKGIPKDPWGNDYVYDPSGSQHNGMRPDIYSNGDPRNPGQIMNR